MEKKSNWVIRHIKCPEDKGKAALLIEWKVERGRKVLNSLSCDNPRLMNYSDEDCHWLCLEKISRGKG